MGKANRSIEIKKQTLPKLPGIYQFIDSNGKIIYVGKAKNLRKRVSSYFNKTHTSPRLNILVKKICDIDYIVSSNEVDALLLENNLIKKYQPRYNVQLKDDKSYPWICIKKEPYPRVFYTRNKIEDGSLYFGPYTHIKTVNRILRLIHDIYPIRTCKLNLSPSAIEKRKYKKCLEYHIKRCLAPCEGLQSEEDYQKNIKQIEKILNGDFNSILIDFKKKMLSSSNSLDFENAEKYRLRIETLSNYQKKTIVVSQKIGCLQIFTIDSNDYFSVVNFMEINNGFITRAHNLVFKKKMQETDLSILTFAIIEIKQRLGSLSPILLLPFDIENDVGSKIIVPKRGEKKEALLLSFYSAKKFLIGEMQQKTITDKDSLRNKILQKAKLDLSLKEVPMHIECFDNSNIQGQHPASACVVFKNGIPSRQDYRHFNINTVEGPDDFASMKEVISRRYSYLKKEGASLPQLIVIDGGKGQLNAAVEAIKNLDLYEKISVISIAKRLEEIFRPDDLFPLYLDKRSETLKLIQNLRDEAHRFSLRHHRNIRNKAMTKSSIDNINGIGPKSIQKLLEKFKTSELIKEASIDELSIIVGKKRALEIKRHFQG